MNMLEQTIAWAVYVAALEAQRQVRYRKLANDRQWKAAVLHLRSELGALGMAL